MLQESSEAVAAAAAGGACSCCGRGFDSAERAPRLLACRHHCCLSCARSVPALGRAGCLQLYCPHCWRRTELSAASAAPPAPAPALELARRLLAPAITVGGEEEWWGGGESLVRETRELRATLGRLRARRREAVLRALDAATTLKARLEHELSAGGEGEDAEGCGTSLESLAAERERLRARLAAAERDARVDDLVRGASAPLTAEQVHRAVAGAGAGAGAGGAGTTDATLLLANHCLAALWSRGALSPGVGASVQCTGSTSLLPHYYLDVEVDGQAAGRVVVAVRADVAPRMARNFSVLVSGALGVGYRGCSVFQCWEHESVITGDFELNNGRGGRSVFEESYFMPDETRLPAARGAVGMRRSQKRHDNLGLVGSQFRIMLREMRGFSAIFGTVVEGLGLVERLAGTGDSAGKPHASIIIANCGRLD